MKTKRKNNLLNFFITILVVVLISGLVVGLLFKNRDSLKVDTSIISLSNDVVTINNSQQDILLGNETLIFNFAENAFNIKPTFAKTIVEIYSNDKLSEIVEFRVDELLYNFARKEDYTSCFDIKAENNTLYIKGAQNLKQLLEKKFKGQEVIVLNQSNIKNLFKCVINYDSKIFSFTFSPQTPVETIVLDKETIIF